MEIRFRAKVHDLVENPNDLPIFSDNVYLVYQESGGGDFEYMLAWYYEGWHSVAGGDPIGCYNLIGWIDISHIGNKLFRHFSNKYEQSINNKSETDTA